MKPRGIKIDDVSWAALKAVAVKLGYVTRQSLLDELIRQFLENYPECLNKAGNTVQVDRMKYEHEKLMLADPEEIGFAPDTEGDMREILGDEVYDSMVAGTISDEMLKEKKEVKTRIGGITKTAAHPGIAEVTKRLGPELPEL